MIWFIRKDGSAVEVKGFISIEKEGREFTVRTGCNTLEAFKKEKQAKEFVENLLKGERICYQRNVNP